MSSLSKNVTHNEDSDGEALDHDPHYEPIVSLPLVEVPTNEEDEEELCKIRSRLYRFNRDDHEWKERGTGDIKLLHHIHNHSVRVVMRRDKTLKICANHFITPDIELKTHCGSDKAYNWSVFADFADETPKQEFLAIKFGSIDNANLWRTKFEEAKIIVKTQCKLYNGLSDSDDDGSVSSTSDDYEQSVGSKSEECGRSLEIKSEDNNVEASYKSDDGILLQLTALKVASKEKEDE